VLLFIALGLLGGVVSTLTGMGGGLLMLTCLSLIVGPHAALALSSPALLVSNAHRAFLLRENVDKRVVTLIGAGAIPGAIVGGLLLTRVPELLVSVTWSSAPSSPSFAQRAS
jgi:uncharacterized membrane protein YfcA